MIPRATQSGPGAHRAIVSDITQEPVATHVLHVPGMGDVLVHHAQAVDVATIEADDGGERIAVLFAQEPCNCGCNARGRGLVLTPDPASARRIAAQMVTIADRIEAKAASQAAAAFAKARGR